MSADWATTKGLHKKAHEWGEAWHLKQYTSSTSHFRRSLPSGLSQKDLFPVVLLHTSLVFSVTEGSIAEPTEEHSIYCRIHAGCQDVSPYRKNKVLQWQSPKWWTLRCKLLAKIHPADVSVSKALSHFPAPGELWEPENAQHWLFVQIPTTTPTFQSEPL